MLVLLALVDLSRVQLSGVELVVCCIDEVGLMLTLHSSYILLRKLCRPTLCHPAMNELGRHPYVHGMPGPMS